MLKNEPKLVRFVVDLTQTRQVELSIIVEYLELTSYVYQIQHWQICALQVNNMSQNTLRSFLRNTMFGSDWVSGSVCISCAVSGTTCGFLMAKSIFTKQIEAQLLPSGTTATDTSPPPTPPPPSIHFLVFYCLLFIETLEVVLETHIEDRQVAAAATATVTSNELFDVFPRSAVAAVVKAAVVSVAAATAAVSVIRHSTRRQGASVYRVVSGI